MSSKTKKQVYYHKHRILSYDVTRNLAIICVVLCHATETIFAQPQIIDNVWLKSLVLILWTIGRTGVPLFLCLSGALLLKRKFTSPASIKKFYKNNLLLLFLVYVVWVCLYNIFYTIISPTHNFSLLDLIRELVFIKQVPFMNMWYFPMIIGVYLFIPALSKLAQSFSWRSLRLPLIIIFTASCIFPMLSLFISHDSNQEPFVSLLNLSFIGGIYGLYVLLGYYISTTKKKLKIQTLTLISVLSFIATIITQYLILLLMPDRPFQLWYDQPFLFIWSISLFALINRYSFTFIPKAAQGLIESVSKLSLGIFFLHVIILILITPFIINLPITSLAKVILLFLPSFFGSLGIVYLMSRNKYLAKYLLYIKSSNRKH